jgi:hypothetical protein
MNQNYNHIHEDFLHLMELSKEERIYALDEDFIINYPKANEIIQTMLHLMNKPKKYRMQNLLLIGEPNMGKTTISRKFYEMNPDRRIEDDMGETLIKAVIYVNVQGPSEKEFYTSILDQFWAPYKTTHSPLRLKQQAIALLKKCNVKTIIFDEIHNILNGTAAKQRNIMDQIKNLSNELMIPIIAVGTKSAAMALYTDMQHVSRFDVIKLQPWELGPDFRGLVQSFEKRLPLQKPSNLISKEKTTLLYDISQGNLGNLHKVLIECARFAIEHDIEEITFDIIKKFSYMKESKATSPKDYATR